MRSPFFEVGAFAAVIISHFKNSNSISLPDSLCSSAPKGFCNDPKYHFHHFLLVLFLSLSVSLFLSLSPFSSLGVLANFYVEKAKEEHVK